MRRPLFDPTAAKQTVSVTLNSDLYSKAKVIGINISKVAEEAVAGEYAARLAATLAAEIRQDVDAANQYAEEHGSFSALMREHYEIERQATIASARGELPAAVDHLFFGI